MKTWSIVVIVDGETLKATSDGTEEGTVFKGQERHVVRAKSLIHWKMNVPLSNVRFGPFAVASYDTALGLTAALVNAGNLEGQIWRAPKDVLEFIKNYEDEHNYEKARFLQQGNLF